MIENSYDDGHDIAETRDVLHTNRTPDRTMLGCALSEEPQDLVRFVFNDSKHSEVHGVLELQLQQITPWQAIHEHDCKRVRSPEGPRRC